MKRKILIGIAAVMLLAMLVPWASATDDTATQAPAVQAPPAQTEPYTLTDDQKKEIEPIYDKITEARKELIQKYVDWGKITQEQGDYYTDRMEEMQEYRLENGFGPGMGRGCGGGGGGRGRMGGWGGQQYAPQTAAPANL